MLLGGSDLAFPHHVYQRALAEAATAVTPFARTTIHVGEVRVDGVKMSKSIGNLVLVDDLLQRYRPGAIRLALLNRPWAEPWDCRESVFEDADRLLAELVAAAGASTQETPSEAVRERLRDDLDVPGAVALALGGGADGADAAQTLVGLLKLSAA